MNDSPTPSRPVDPAPDTAAEQWLSVPEVAERLGVRDREVRSMLRDRRLSAVRREEGRGPQIPVDFLVPDEDDPARWQPLPSLRGTLVLLSDCGLDDEQSMRWLREDNEELGESPLTALRRDRTHVVRRIAQTLAL